MYNDLTPDPVPSNQQPQWLPWTEHVYLAVCHAMGKIYVKVGMTNNPSRRMSAFMTSCPFRLSELYVCQAPERPKAYGLEQQILRTFRSLSQQGEWLCVPNGKLDSFLASCTGLAKKQIGDVVRFREYVPPAKARYTRKRKY